MKVKLLKKIRKRFKILKSDGYFCTVLDFVDKEQITTTIDRMVNVIQGNNWYQKQKFKKHINGN